MLIGPHSGFVVRGEVLSRDSALDVASQGQFINGMESCEGIFFFDLRGGGGTIKGIFWGSGKIIILVNERNSVLGNKSLEFLGVL